MREGPGRSRSRGSVGQRPLVSRPARSCPATLSLWKHSRLGYFREAVLSFALKQPLTQAVDKTDIPWTFLGPVVENPPASTGDTDSVPGREDPTRYGQLSLGAATLGPHGLKLTRHSGERRPRTAAGEGLSSGAALCFATKPKNNPPQNVIPFLPDCRETGITSG